ncbi:MAG TPA: TRAP transporter small permease [Casimicrobiaceae bacterium]|nr:TRAP transporter small permease [Casimicrobiaceae bacterium]
MRRLLDRLYDIAGALAAVAVLAIFVVMISAAVMRQLGMRTGGSDDIVSWLTAAAAFLAMAHAFRHGDFVRVVLLLDRLPVAWRRRFEIVCLVVAAAFVGFLALAAVRFVHESWAFNDIANGMIAIPLWIPQLSFAIGALSLLVAVVDELVGVLRGVTPSYVRAVEERHARGDFTEDV